MTSKIREVLQNIKYGHIAFCFCVPWCIFYFGRLVFFNPYKVPLFGKFTVYNVLFPVMLFFVIGFIVTCSHRVKQKYSLAAIVIWTLLLIIIDHAMKIGILQYFGKSNIPVFNYTPGEEQSFSPSIPLIGDWLFIQSYLNTRYLLSSQNLFIRVIVYLLCLPIALFFVFRYFIFMKRDRRFTTLAFILFLAFMICSLIDKAVYGGSYDYIRLAQFGVLDLKDFYGFIGISFLFLADGYDKSFSVFIKDLFLSKSTGFVRHEYQSLKSWFSGKILIVRRDK